MSEYIGLKVKVKCKRNGDVIGYVSSVTDDEIILTKTTSDSLPGIESKCLILKASEIVDLDLVESDAVNKFDDQGSQFDSSQKKSEEAPSTRCAYVCPTTPVRPMRPMRAMKNENLLFNEPTSNDSNSAGKTQGGSDVKMRVQQKQQSLVKSQLYVSPVYPKQQSQLQVQSRNQQNIPKNVSGVPNLQNERSETVPGNMQMRRRAFSANYEGSQMATPGVGRGADINAGQPHNAIRRPSRSREPWFDMSVSSMKEEFDFESNLLQFDKNEFYRQVDAQNQRQNVSPITVRNRGGAGDSPVNTRNMMRSSGNNMGRKNSRAGRDSCFDMDVSQMNQEFDFEGNLAQFNKNEFYKEVDERRQRYDKDKLSPEPTHRRPDVVPEPKFRHDENVIQSSLPIRQPITLPTAWRSSERKFRCPDGLVLPACPVELRQSVFTAAETHSLSWSCITEMYARAVCELILEQVGGKVRLRPNNDHQLPHIVVLAGHHVQGGLGVAVARHLSSRRCAVSLIIPPMRIGQMEAPREMLDQMKLYRNLTGNNILTDLESCPSKTMDFIVSALESHEESKNELLLFQPWISQIIAFCNANRPPCLVVDPPPGRGFIRPRIVVGLGLPLATKTSEQNKATYYLCDVGLTAKVYQHVGIQYTSPFTCRSILQLNEIDEDGEDCSSGSTCR